MNPVAIILLGGTGRLGRAVVDLAADESDVRVTGCVSPSASDLEQGIPGFTDLGKALDHCTGVVVDVSVAEGAAERIRTVATAGRPLVQGTTGLNEVALAALEAAGRDIPVVWAPNFSPGVVLLRRALQAVLGSAPASWDMGILDRHHAAKVDRPSGTARALTAELAGGDRSIPEVASFRQGGVFGEHTVFLTGENEEVTLTHRAFSRRVFAEGAVAAARFAAVAEHGLYGMDDVFPGGDQA